MSGVGGMVYRMDKSSKAFWRNCNRGAAIVGWTCAIGIVRRVLYSSCYIIMDERVLSRVQGSVCRVLALTD